MHHDTPSVALTEGFVLHPRLAADSVWVLDLALCQLRIQNDARYPWLVLVPRRAEVRELYQLSAADQWQVWQEILQLQQVLQELSQAYKLNLGALGNVVEQLHIHIIARFPDDASWPGPVWGQGVAQPYTPQALEQRCAQLRAALATKAPAGC